MNDNNEEIKLELTKEQKYKFRWSIIKTFSIYGPILLILGSAIIYLISIYKTMNIIFCAALIITFLKEFYDTAILTEQEINLIKERIDKRLKKNKKSQSETEDENEQ